MFEIAALISRFFFLAYIVVFCFALYYYKKADSRAALLFMRLPIVFLHVHAFVLMCFYPGVNAAEMGIIAAATLLVIVFCLYIFRRNISQNLYIALFLTDLGLICQCMLNLEYAKRQALFFAVSVIILYVIKLVLPRISFVSKLWPVFLSLSIILLAVIFLFGSEEYGATNWIRFGSFSFQPSEFVKIFYVLFMASLLFERQSMKRQLMACAASALLCLLLVLHKDLGGAMIVFISFLLIFYASTGNFFLCLAAVACAVLAFAVGLNYFPEHFSHVTVRIQGWLEPFAHADTSGYQLIMSLFAICSYGPFGIGLMRGLSSTIPFVEKDFIFAPICENFGYVFGMFVMVLYVVFFVKAIAGINRKSGFLQLAVFGFASMIAVQSIVILGANIGFLPITGVTLPFVSYGGSSLLSSFIMLGFILFCGSQEEVSAHE